MLVLPLDAQLELRFPERVKCAIAVTLQTMQTKYPLRRNYTDIALIALDQSVNLFGCLEHQGRRVSGEFGFPVAFW